MANRQPGWDVVQVHGTDKCQEDQHHNIHLPHLTGQVSNQDALGLVVQTAWCQSKAFLWPMPSQMEGSWVTACTQAFGQTPARPWNILSVPQQRPQWLWLGQSVPWPTLQALYHLWQQRGKTADLSVAGVELHTPH